MISFARSKRRKKCRGCGNWYLKKYWVSREQWEKRSHYCSNICRMEAAHAALRGKKPWNSGLHSKDWQGENNGLWKGEKATYGAIHQWMKRWYKKIGICEKCKEIKKTTWANISGKYLRKREDWKELCYSCHWHLDREHENNHRYKKETLRKYRK